MKCIVTDIDGTICEKLPSGPLGAWENRLHNTPPKPIIPMRTLLQATATGGLFVLYATARRNFLRTLTLNYLAQHSFPAPSELFMRPDTLQLSQDMLKLRYLKHIRAEGWDPVAWFEDDPAVIDALKSAGVNAIAC